MQSINPYELLAAICKFVVAQKIDEQFYRKHFNAIETSSTFAKVLATNYPLLEVAFRKSLPMHPKEGALVIQQAIEECHFSDERMAWFGKQLAVSVTLLGPVVQDRALPKMLEWCKSTIEKAYQAAKV